jgi:ketosteroid isomerase-like protein
MTNREVVENQIDAFNRSDFDEAERLMLPDVVVDFSRSMGPASGVYRGVARVREFVESLLDSFESIVATPMEMYERGDWIAVDVHVRFRGRESGVDVDARGGRAYRLRDGKIAHVVLTQAMREAREFVDAQTG